MSLAPILRPEDLPYGPLVPQLYRVWKEVVVPTLRARWLGQVVEMDLEYVVHTYQYEGRDAALLRLFERGGASLWWGLPHSEYWRYQRQDRGRGVRETLRRVGRYRRVFDSIRTRGWQADPGDARSHPWMLCARDVFFRMDGHHRAAVARYLGFERIPALKITPRDLLEGATVPDELAEFLRTLDPPDWC